MFGEEFTLAQLIPWQQHEENAPIVVIGADRRGRVDDQNRLSLTWLLDNSVPLNRKERYYTGTVLPGIVCSDNMANLHLLTGLMGHPDVEVGTGRDDFGVLFFTEYGFAESAYGPSARRCNGLPSNKDTPDVVFLVLRPRPVLFALEAKLFDRPGGHALRRQLDLQRGLLEPLARRAASWLGVAKVDLVQYALLPEAQLGLNIGHYDKLAWQDLLTTYALVAPEYWLAVLDEALTRYDDLVTKIHHNDDGRLTGREIVESILHGQPQYTSMGRAGGLAGQALRDDMESGRWLEIEYQVANGEPPNANWFGVEEFAHALGFSPPEGKDPISRFTAAVGWAESVSTRVFGDGSVARSLVDAARRGQLDAADPEQLARVANLYLLAAETAKHARRSAAGLLELMDGQ